MLFKGRPNGVVDTDGVFFSQGGDDGRFFQEFQHGRFGT